MRIIYHRMLSFDDTTSSTRHERRHRPSNALIQFFLWLLIGLRTFQCRGENALAALLTWNAAVGRWRLPAALRPIAVVPPLLQTSSTTTSTAAAAAAAATIWDDLIRSATTTTTTTATMISTRVLALLLLLVVGLCWTFDKNLMKKGRKSAGYEKVSPPLCQQNTPLGSLFTKSTQASS